MLLSQTRDVAGAPPRVDPPRRRSRSLRSRAWDHRWHYVFVLPMLITFVAFTLWPMVASWVYSLYEWQGYGPLEDFVGLDNFRRAIADPLFWNAMGNTGIFALFGVFVQLPLALLLAIVLNNTALRGRAVYRVLFFLPVVTTTVVVGVVFDLLLNPSGGPINEFLRGIGLIEQPINFLGDEALALPTVLFVDMWKGIGITIIYWLAALQSIPSEVYEAARVDGANRVQVFTRITVPLIAPLGAVILLLTLISSLNAFDIVKVMTNGGPNRSTEIIQTYIFNYAFDPEGIPLFGFASAAGIIFGLAAMVVSVLPLLLRRRRQASIGPVVAKEDAE
ncbi:carbohydrate ABC transporter permease [Agromyces sp. SYSU T00194]|uniref:carbohydrate ABC transporter permease n=1 Tax=Agromyces chitinivorans TaxID=3158560 RepID=UPI00339A5099